MAHKTIVIDVNRCVGCCGCNTACKTVNDVEIGNFWTRVLRVNNTPEDQSNWPEGVDWYYLPMQCQHCEDAPCVNVCPTGASYYDEDGTVQVDPEACIGCQSCVSACPYGVRYMDEVALVAKKCNMCKDLTAEGGIPQCVSQCAGLAKWYGDIDEDPTMMSFKGGNELTFGEACMPFSEDEIHTLPDAGNHPSLRYIVRGHQWRDDIDFTPTQGGHGFCLPNY